MTTHTEDRIADARRTLDGYTRARELAKEERDEFHVSILNEKVSVALSTLAQAIRDDREFRAGLPHTGF